MSDIVDRFLGASAPAELRRFVAYWNAKRAGRLLPSFEDIDPTEVPWALSQLYVLRVVEGGEFVYRLAGGKVEDPYGRSLKGARISDLYPTESAAVIQARWTRVASEPACCYTNTEHPSPRDTFIAARRVTMPLGADGRTADHVLGFAVFDRVQITNEPLIGGAVIREVSWLSLGRPETP